MFSALESSLDYLYILYSNEDLELTLNIDTWQVAEVFYYAQKVVLHPTTPLFDQETQTIKPCCVRELKRIIILCDHDRDGALSDAKLNDFQAWLGFMVYKKWQIQFFLVIQGRVAYKQRT